MNIETMQEKYFNRPGKSFLKIMDLETGEITTVFKEEHVIEAPNWTMDGSALIFNALGKIYRFDLEKRSATQVDTGSAILCNNDHVLSFDGQWLAVSQHNNEDGNSRIYTLPLEGGSPKLITEKGPSYLHGWSPDGKTFAYCAEREGQYDVYTIDERGIEVQLTNEPGLDDGPEYSPDGQYIWFNSVRSGLMQIYRMKTDGSEVTRMTHDEANNWFAHVSPNGQEVVYIAYKKGDVEPGDHPANKNVAIMHMKSDGSNPRKLVDLFGGQGTMNVNSWSPDSRKFAFVTYQL